MSRFYIDDATSHEVARSADISVLIAGGEIDYSASPCLRECLLAAVKRGIRHVVVDLSAVTFIDSTAIGALVAAATRLRAGAGGSVTVVCDGGNERVQRIFDIAAVASLITLHCSWAHALSALDAARALDARETAGRVSASAASVPDRPSRSRVASRYVTESPAADGACDNARSGTGHVRYKLDERA
jgi:anti-sigma B factor antagonist